eukprot:TRINITY_DN9906_c0_g1_i1.p1 TRINITY_DN9906_c0_g1~~TRINITY_DN9906_c0_g1_i1.p1  ORF type:complete len:379 (-),score=97.85 TRINITY_DN9906_c0_g1_i1:15-1130(-)
MTTKLVLALLATLFLVQTLVDAQYLTQEQRKTLVDTHNDLRRYEVNNSPFGTITDMKMVKYDPRLEVVAQNYQDAHSSWSGHNSDRSNEYQAIGGEGYCGENWYSSSPNSAADAWVNYKWRKDGQCSEREDWYELGVCTDGRDNIGNYGHFTQVVWAKSGLVGCGLNPGTLCNYYEGGNFGTAPYEDVIFTVGSNACDDCPSGWDFCVDGLCSDVDPSLDCSCVDSPTGECVSDNVCECYYGFTGDECGEYDCACRNSEHGQCTFINTCECDDGWRGDTCEEFDCSCYGSDNGECTAANVCTCEEGYEGNNCVEVTENDNNNDNEAEEEITDIADSEDTEETASSSSEDVEGVDNAIWLSICVSSILCVLV